MPPKKENKKAGKGKTSAAVGGLITEEKSKEQLWEEALGLQEELESLRKEKIHFREERDKAIAGWEISKRNLVEEDAKLRSKEMARQAAKERHQAEIAEYKQKLKHILTDHHNTASGLKINAIASTLLIQNQDAESEIRLQEESLSMEEDLMERKQQTQKRIEEIKQRHQAEFMELENDFKNKVTEMEVEYQEKWKSMSEESAKQCTATINELDEKMKIYVKDLMEEHDKSLQEAHVYYEEIHQKHKDLKHCLGKIERQKKINTKCRALEEEIECLEEELMKEKQKQAELQKQQKEMKRARGQAAMKRTPVKVIEKEKRELLVKHELLLQACEKVEQERDDIQKKTMQTILEIERKSALKDLLLEKKIAAQTETLEKTQAYLYAVLAAQGDSSAAAKYEELMESKRAQMKAADDALDQECKKYDRVRKMVKEKLTALGVPLYDIPLKTSAQILRELSPLNNSAVHTELHQLPPLKNSAVHTELHQLPPLKNSAVHTELHQLPPLKISAVHTELHQLPPLKNSAVRAELHQLPPLKISAVSAELHQLPPLKDWEDRKL